MNYADLGSFLFGLWPVALLIGLGVGGYLAGKSSVTTNGYLLFLFKSAHQAETYPLKLGVPIVVFAIVVPIAAKLSWAVYLYELVFAYGVLLGMSASDYAMAEWRSTFRFWGPCFAGTAVLLKRAIRQEPMFGDLDREIQREEEAQAEWDRVRQLEQNGTAQEQNEQPPSRDIKTVEEGVRQLAKDLSVTEVPRPKPRRMYIRPELRRDEDEE